MIRKLDPRHWRSIRRAFQWVRRTLFSHPRKPPQLLVVDAELEEVRQALGDVHFTNSWELSYNYEGEDQNKRRPVLVEEHDRPWRQDHVRGWDVDAGVELRAHREAEPTEYPHAHLTEPATIEPAVVVATAALEHADLEVARSV